MSIRSLVAGTAALASLAGAAVTFLWQGITYLQSSSWPKLSLAMALRWLDGRSWVLLQRDWPEAYRTLLLDVLEGDQTLFVHADEVEESWRLFMPIIQSPPRLRSYAAGTWGPREADGLAILETALWQGG